MKKFLSIFLAISIIMCSAVGGWLLYENYGYLFESSKSGKLCTVKFDCGGGSTIDSQTVEKGSMLEYPGIPTRDGYAFVGWYSTKTNQSLVTSQRQNQFDFSKPVTDSFTVYARWVDITDTTDTDGDGLTNAVEEFYKTNTALADTDGDLISDYIEIVILNLNPLEKDSNRNGVNDGEEDADGDGLNNITEIDLGTDPILNDTDDDGISDIEEVYNYDTDAADSDTDNDGANDGWEISNGFDPLTYNSAFDVVVKANNVSQSPVVAQVQIQTNGKQASSLKVEEVSSDDGFLTSSIPGYLGSAYDFTMVGAVTDAIITFEYDTMIGQISDEFQPRIYYYNEEECILQELDNQTVENGKVSVTVSHFSKYILLNKVEFDQVWDTEIKPPLSSGESDRLALDMMFVIDYSSSMDDNDPEQLFKELSEKFILKLENGRDKAGAVKFIRKAYLVSGLSEDKDQVIAAINDIQYDSGYNTYSGTDGSAGIKMALDNLIESDAKYKFMVFLTDGQDNGYSYTYDSLVEIAQNNNITIYAIGMGNASESVLKKISSNTGGKYYHAIGASDSDLIDLESVFADIEASTIDITSDSNNDGIADYFNDLIKQGSLTLGNATKPFAGKDFNYDMHGDESDDYDCDGVKNGDELVVVKVGDFVFVKMISDPMRPDSDGDRIPDDEDNRPLEWDVSDRDLVMFAEIVYHDVMEGTEISWLNNCYINIAAKINGSFGKKASLEELSGWSVLRSSYNHITGMQCAAYINGKKIVVAYRGSEKNDFLDILDDWVTADILGWITGFNSQAYPATRFITNIMQDYPGYEIYITGHSLGGNLAYHAGNQALFIDSTAVKKITVYNGLGLQSGVSIEATDFLAGYYLWNNQDIITSYRVKGDVISVLPLAYHYGTIKETEQCDHCKGVIGAHNLHSFLVNEFEYSVSND